jgi:DNA-binding response OmpR family regulator
MTKRKRTILVIEDDAAIRQGVVDAVEFEGYGTLEAGDGDHGLELALSGTYDLLLLDLVLPGRDGLDILGELRAARPAQPVIIMTARGAESDRVRGLDLGADDYVVKPFSVRELMARIEAVLRRSAERPTDIREITIPGGTVNLSRREVQLDDGVRHELSEREVELLRYLAANGGRAVSRDEILSRVWGIDPVGVMTRTIDMHIARLREKLGDDSADPKLILTVRGKGYMFADGKGT